MYETVSCYWFGDLFIKNYFFLGQIKDSIAIGSDSGKLSVIEYDTEKERFVPIHMETFGKTGCRRIIPGQYIAVDPKGRALMIGYINFGVLSMLFL
jgi:splicing factor 3B subunit 3